jgi:alanine-synthesizing transaminase
VYPRAVLEKIAQIAERRNLVVFSDEIYDQIVYDGAEFVPMAALVHDTLCVTMSGLSKVYRACGYRVGWAVLSGKLRGAQDFISSMELLASLRLCSNVPGQWAVQTALGGYQSVKELVTPGGRLYESRRVIVDSIAASEYLSLNLPRGAMYAFPGIDLAKIPDFDDQSFALDLLEQKHVLVAPGVSFNVSYRNHFRITNLPDSATLKIVFQRIDELLNDYRSGTRSAPRARVVDAQTRFTEPQARSGQ